MPFLYIGKNQKVLFSFSIFNHFPSEIEKANMGMIIGIVVAIAVILIIAIVVAVVLKKKRSGTMRSRERLVIQIILVISLHTTEDNENIYICIRVCLLRVEYQFA